jgi:hypothetical protein
MIDLNQRDIPGNPDPKNPERKREEPISIT